MEKAMKFFLMFLVGSFSLTVLVQGKKFQNPGFISIDCGAPTDYDDETIGISYKTDADFVSTGLSSRVLNNVSNRIQLNMRIFPKGTRNCYTLTPDKGRENPYLIRAYFWYGNYDGKNQVPSFDLYIDVHKWTTVNTGDDVYKEIISVAPRDDIQLCLVNTGSGTPFISGIELRLLPNSTYRVDSGALVTMWRYNIGGDDSPGSIRYPDDEYDRIWYSHNYDVWEKISSNTTVDFSTHNDDYKVPVNVLRTAAQSTGFDGLNLYWALDSAGQRWGICAHFGEFQVLQQDQVREFEVYALDKLMETVRLEFAKPETVFNFSYRTSGANVRFIVKPTSQSNLPVILNAIEFMKVIDLTTPLTAFEDADAMYDIKKVYNVTKDSWQGDPCSPKEFMWEGLSCSGHTMPRNSAK